MLIIASKANSYDPVSSKIMIVPAIGAPITEEETAAIPQITMPTAPGKSKPSDARICRAIAPPAAPITKEGENIPPKSPIPKHTEVRIIFKNRTTNKKANVYCIPIAPRTVSPPKPSVSGTKAPPAAVIAAAIRTACAGVKRPEAVKAATLRTLNIKPTASTPKKGPSRSAMGKRVDKSPSNPPISKRVVPPQNNSVTPAATQEAMAIGAMAFREKCRIIASWANMTPAIGALKPAEIAAATPHPMKISVEIPLLENRFSALPITAPKCTSGPYWPTEAPPEALKKATSVEDKPDFISNSLSVRCAA